MQYTHVSFSDESNWNSGRYRSIGMLSAARADALALHQETLRLLRESGVDELKWKKIRTAKYRFAAQKLIDACGKAISDGHLRIDVLVWDSQDSRHAVRNPDVEANLQIMYFHLFKNVMSRRWPSGCVWRHIPDEHVGVKWDTLHSCLAAKDSLQVSELALDHDCPPGESFGASIRRIFRGRRDHRVPLAGNEPHTGGGYARRHGSLLSRAVRRVSSMEKKRRILRNSL